MIRILCLGDVVGQPGREAIRAIVPDLIQRDEVDFVIANAENVAGGSGITAKTAIELFSCGVDVITSGDHFVRKREVFQAKELLDQILRPVNFPEGMPGRGFGVFRSRRGHPVGVINLAGRVFMRYYFDCPFRAVDRILPELANETKAVIVDFHAEATSEKVALSWYLDGRVSAVVGSHTHIQTADEQIRPHGTAYITDLGMTGPYNSVIGRSTQETIERFITQIPTRIEVADGDPQLHGVIITIDETTGQALKIDRIQRRISQ